MYGWLSQYGSFSADGLAKSKMVSGAQGSAWVSLAAGSFVLLSFQSIETGSEGKKVDDREQHMLIRPAGLSNLRDGVRRRKGW